MSGDLSFAQRLRVYSAGGDRVLIGAEAARQFAELLDRRERIGEMQREASEHLERMEAALASMRVNAARRERVERVVTIVWVWSVCALAAANLDMVVRGVFGW